MKKQKYLAILLAITIFINIMSVNIYSNDMFDNVITNDTENTILQDDVSTSTGIDVLNSNKDLERDNKTEESNKVNNKSLTNNQASNIAKDNIVENSISYQNEVPFDKETIFNNNVENVNNIIAENIVDNIVSDSSIKIEDIIITSSSISVDVPEGTTDKVISTDITLSEDMYCLDVTIKKGTVNLNGHTLTVLGELNQSGGTVNINGGELIVNGNYSLSKLDSKCYSSLNMSKDNDYVLVKGNFYINSYSTSILSNGVLEIKGDFEQKNSGFASNFCATGNHTTIFSGNMEQSIFFETPKSSYFKKLEIKNKSLEGIRFNSGINSLTNFNLNGVKVNNFSLVGGNAYTLNKDLYINGDFIINSPININGYKLNVNGNLKINSETFNINKGEVKVLGSCYQNGGMVWINGGKLKIANDFKIGNEENQVAANLKMVDASDEIFVGKNFLINSQKSNSGYLTAGILEVKGDFEQIGNSGNSKLSFCTSKNHNVKLSGIGLQNVSIEAKGYSVINNMICTKPLNEGYIFSHKPLWNNVIEQEEENNNSSISIKDFKAVNVKSGIKLIWNCDEAIQYTVYRNGEKIATLADTEFQDRTVIEGESYIYEIYGYGVDSSDYGKSEAIEITAQFSEIENNENLAITGISFDNNHIFEDNNFILTIKNCGDEKFIKNNEKIIIFVNNEVVFEKNIENDIVAGAEKIFRGTIDKKYFEKCASYNIKVELISGENILNAYTYTLELKSSDIQILEVNPISTNLGQAIEYSVNIKNIGEVATPKDKAYKIKIIVKYNDEEIVLTGNLSRLLAGKNTNIVLKYDENGKTYTYNVNSQVEAVCFVDYENIIKESDEENNLYELSYSLGKADLIIEDIQPKEIYAGSNVILRALIKNIGQIATPKKNYFIRYTFDDNRTINSYNCSACINVDDTYNLSTKTIQLPVSSEDYKVKAEIINTSFEELSLNNNSFEFIVKGDKTNPTTPKNVILSGTTESGFTLSWNKSTDNDLTLRYKVFRNEKEIADINSLKYVDTELENCSKYEYFVIAYDRAGNQSEKSEIKIYDNEAPKKVEGLTYCELTESSVKLLWKTAIDNIKTEKYYIFRDGVKIGESSDIYYIDNTINNLKKYSYSIIAVDSQGNLSEKSDDIEIEALKDEIIPEKVVGLKVSNKTLTSITLSWNNGYDNVGIAYYEIFRDGTKIGESDKNSYTDLNLEAGSLYSYSVKAVDLSGNKSDISDSISSTPNNASILSVTPVYGSTFGGDTYVNCSVSCVNDSNANGLRAEIEILKEDISVIKTDIGLPTVSNTQIKFVYKWQLKTMPDGEYKIKYYVYDSDGNEVTAETYCYLDHTPPAKISGFEAKSEGGNATLSWFCCSDSDFKCYKIYRSEENEENYKLINTISDKNKLSYVDKDVYINAVYSYRITAVDKYNQESEYSQSEACLIADDVESPTILSIMPDDETIISPITTISVMAEDNGNIRKIKLQYSLDNSEWIDIGERENCKTASFNLSALKLDGTVYIRAVAEDTMGNISDNYYVRTYTADFTGPERIAYITPTAYSDKVLLNWADVSDEDFSYFLVEYKKSDAEKFNYSKKVSDKRGTYITNLANNTEYIFRVVAYDKFGNRGESSDEVAVRTLADTTAPKVTRISPCSGRYENFIPLIISANDNTKLKRIIVYVAENGGEYKEVTREEYNSVSATLKYNLALADYAEGLISVTAVGEDIYGNVGKIGDFVCEYYVDHTAPEKPRGVKIEAAPEGGYITISWEQGKETDLESYRLYRKHKGETSLIATGLKTLSYRDRAVIDKESYNYYVTAVDTTGHESGKSTMEVNSGSSSDYNESENIIDNSDENGIIVLEDTEKPQIVSVSPSVNSMLPANPQISVKAKDNKKLKAVKLEYDNCGSWVEIGRLEAIAYAEVFYFKWDTSSIDDGKYTLRATAYDISGNESEPYKIGYILNVNPPTAPILSGEAGGYCSILKWSKVNDSDLMGYYVYRSLENQKNWKMAAYISNTEYTDKDLTAGRTYVYKVVSVDKIGNRAESNIISVIPTEADEKAPNAVITSSDEGYTTMEISFSAKSSTDNIAITRYSWDFGDGSVGSSFIAPSHKYDKTGEYKVTLTVYDKAGNSSQAEKTITIKDASKNGTALITVLDKDSREKLGGAKVFVRCPDGRGEKFECKADGTFILTGRGGTYEICFYKEDYLPTSVKLTLKDGEYKEETAEMKHSKIVVGTMSVKRMSLEEIEAVGIDTDKAENQTVYKYRIKLAFEAEEEYKDIYVNDRGDIYYGEIKTASEYKLIYEDGVCKVSVTAIKNKNDKKPTVVYIIMPGGTSWLKEFFEVKLVLDNNADEGFDIVNSRVTLNLPDGVTFVPTEYSDSKTINIGTLKGSSSQEVKWVIRGDAKGEYDISADFTGTLMPFGEELKAVFKPKDSFRVYGSDALKMYIEIPDYMTSGEEIAYKVGVKNVAGFDVNNVKLNLAFDGSECYSRRTIETLKPEETIYLEGTFVANRSCNVSVSDIVDLSSLDESIEWEIKTITVPLKIEVYDDYRNPEIRGERVFAVTAEIYNQKNYDAKNVKAELIFNNPNDVEMIDKYESPELIRKLESLKAGERIRLEWEFHIKDGVDLEEFGYSVRISADGYEEKIYTNKLDTNYLNKIKIQYEMTEKSDEPLQNVKVNVKYNNASTVYVLLTDMNENHIYEKSFKSQKEYGEYSFELVLEAESIYYIKVIINKDTADERTETKTIIVSGKKAEEEELEPEETRDIFTEISEYIANTIEFGFEGNYYKGNVTFGGIAVQVLIGCVPYVGQAADIRDISADMVKFGELEHPFRDTAIDIIAIFPLLDSLKGLKYTDELSVIVKRADKVISVKVEDCIENIAEKLLKDDEIIAIGIKNGDDLYIAEMKESKAVGDVVKYNLDEVVEGGTETIKFNEVKTFTAEETNQWFIDNVKPDYKPPYKPGTLVKEIELTKNTTFVRVYDNMPDGSGMYGSWVMKADDIKGLTPLGIQNKFALPNTPKYVCDVELEAGTHIRVGEVNPLDGWGNGGGIQYDLIGQRIGDFKNERLLEGN